MSLETWLEIILASYHCCQIGWYSYLWEGGFECGSVVVSAFFLWLTLSVYIASVIAKRLVSC